MPNAPAQQQPVSVTTHRCAECRQDRPGRFTKHKFSSFGGWSQGRHLPLWYCWTCLPRGDGRGEQTP